MEKRLDNDLPAPTYFVRLAEGIDPISISAALESVFLKNGLESVDLIQELRDTLATQLVFQQLMLGFLTVGLVVGVAALGVISTRSVVSGLAYTMTLLTTWLPAVQASRVRPAEALRYE